jgi:ABC-type amino acid transport substrate-binding protein
VVGGEPAIRVAYHPTWFPFEHVGESGRLAGVTPQYMSEFGRITGADFVQIPISDWTDALDSVRDRDADVIFMVASTADRLEYMGFTTPHYTIGTSLATLGDQQVDINDEGLRLLTIRNHAIEAWLDENHPDVKYVSVDGYAAGLEMMQAGDADALAATWQPVYSHAEIAGIEGLYNAGPTGHEYDITIGYRNDQPVLGSILQKALDEIPLSALAQMFQSQISE